MSLRSVALMLLIAGCNPPGCGTPPAEAERADIEAALSASDTRVTYADGETVLGAIFDTEHRYALTFEELPLAWTLAIIAAEDGRFWSHGGFDAGGIARAARDNLGAGGVVSGGSTLTQQLAKNLFERPGRSLAAKWEELDYAMHLEELFSKPEILTLYANVFHVTGTGSGLGVAARYFFDKVPSKLDLPEAAFIAGLVKGPANYDPFPGDAEHQAQARARALERTRYVLQRLVDEDLDRLVPPGAPTARAAAESLRTQATALLDKGFELDFQRGAFRHASNTLVDEVKRRLATPFFRSILDEAGIGQVERAGLTVVTTVDLGMQHEAIYGLWHQLTELGTLLEGLGAGAYVLDAGQAPDLDLFDRPVRHQLRAATVVSHHKDGALQLDMGGFACVADRAALVRAAAAVYRGAKKDRWAKVPTSEIDAFSAALADGSVVWVSVREGDPGKERCDLEARPELQGAVVVVQDGRIRARVGGNTNRDFDRTRALRQFGSTFKPLVYHAAMTLGWRPDDVLLNRPTTFTFSGSRYAPKPDHDPIPEVSMAWAGVRSENIASVWLLVHLVDQLSPDEVAAVAQMVGLAREDGETDPEYRTRIQQAGVTPTRRDLPGIHAAAARAEVAARLVQQGQIVEARAIRAAGDSRDLTTLQGRLEACKTQYRELRRGVRRDREVDVDDLWARRIGRRVELACGVRIEGFDPAAELVEASSDAGPAKAGKAKSRSWKAKVGLRGPSGGASPRSRAPDLDVDQLPALDDVLMSESLTWGAVNALGGALERQRAAMEASGGDLYSPGVLYWHPDFRVLVAMRYVTQLAASYGVQTELKEVLSLPLGATEITLEEATVLYAGLVSGRAVPAPDPALGPATLIAEIRDREGRAIYKAELTPTRVADAKVADMTADILRNVVIYGTGRAAQGAVTADGADVPLGGKTGTTNDFRNAAFLGFAPAPGRGGYRAGDGHAVGVYVGYDDNREMRAGNLRVSGAVGALPAWIATVQGVYRWSDDAPPPGGPGGGGWVLAHAPGLVPTTVEDGASVLTLVDRDPGLVSRAPSSAPDGARPSARISRPPARPVKRPWWQVW